MEELPKDKGGNTTFENSDDDGDDDDGNENEDVEDAAGADEFALLPSMAAAEVAEAVAAAAADAEPVGKAGNEKGVPVEAAAASVENTNGIMVDDAGNAGTAEIDLPATTALAAALAPALPCLRSAAAAPLVAAAPVETSSPSFGRPNTELPSSSPIARSSAK